MKQNMHAGFGILATFAVSVLLGAARDLHASIKVGTSNVTSAYTCTTDGETIEVSGEESGNITADADCTIILQDVTWTSSKTSKFFISINPGKTVWVKLSGNNILSAAKNSSNVTCIRVVEGATLHMTNITASASLEIDASEEYGQAIGSGKDANCTAGEMNFWGGDITAKSYGKGAGIGGYESDGGTINIYGGTITASVKAGSKGAGAGIGGGYGHSAVVNIYGGQIDATGGKGIEKKEDGGGAGIGCGASGSGGVVNIYGGRVTAQSKAISTNDGDKFGGAGIGGGCFGHGGEVNIYGGEVYATGYGEGAGIGGGDRTGNGGIVKVYGGVVHATGDEYAAGIGGGSGGDAGEFYNYGGTVFASAGRKDSGKKDEADIGAGSRDSQGASTLANPFVMLGGSTYLKYGKYEAYGMGAASNGTERVYLVTVSGLQPNAKCEFSGLGSYGQNSIVADEDGIVYLWLPNGQYSFKDEEGTYTATVSDASATAVRTDREWPAGAGSMKIAERIEQIEEGIAIGAIIYDRDGVLKITDMSFSKDETDGGDFLMSISFVPELPENIDFAKWVLDTNAAGKFVLRQSATIAGLENPEERQDKPVTVEIADEQAKILALTEALFSGMSEADGGKTMFYRIVVLD